MACVCPLAATSRFIGFNKVECANNCLQRREAKPPHVLQIGEEQETNPASSASEGPRGHKESIMLLRVTQPSLCRLGATLWRL